MKKNKYLLSFLIIALVRFTFAQDVNLEVAGNREIEPAFRIMKRPQLIDTIVPYSEIQYPLLTLKYETTFALDTIKFAKIKLVEQLEDLSPGYIRVGIGSKLMPLAELTYTSTRSRKYIYSASLKHLSSFGQLKGYAPAQFDRTGVNLSGTLNENKYNIDGRVHFNSFGLHQYGFQNERANKDSIANRFSDVGVSALYSKHKKDSLNFNYNVGFTYNYFQDKKNKVDSLAKWNAHENFIEINGKGWYKLKKEIINVDVDTKINNYKYGILGDTSSLIDTALVTTDFITSLKPNIITYAKNNRLKVKFGVDVTLNYTDLHRVKRTKVFVYPDVEIKYSLFNDILIPYLEVKGGLVQNTFKSLSRQNEFVLSNLNLQNENQVINTTLGIKGTLTNRITFNANAKYSVIKNKALFITDTLYANKNQFRVIYDDLQVTTIQGSISYQSSEKIKIEGIGVFNSYLTKHNSFAWNLPQIQFIARGFYRVLDNLNLQMDLNLEGGRFTQVYTKEEADRTENNQYAKQLGFIPDFNLGAEYLYSKKMSAFLQCNNFVAQRYKRWYNYPVQGFQVMGGVTFKF